jgi:hypothetical protein
MDPFTVVRLTTALPVPIVAVAWFVSWTPKPDADTDPLVVFGVILHDARTGKVKLTLPFVEVTV